MFLPGRATRRRVWRRFPERRGSREKALFDAVVVSMQSDVAARVERAARIQPKIWDRLSEGLGAYLDACLEPAYGRIVIQEAPAVLGHRRYREIEEAYPMALLIGTMNALERHGEIVCEDPELLARMVDAMICKAALMLAETDDPKKLRKRVLRMVDVMLVAFRKT